MYIGPVMQFKLAAPLHRGCIDPGGCHSLEMINTSSRIDDMERFVAAFESVLDERKRHVVLVLTAVEEGADMTSIAKHGAGDLNRSVGLSGYIAPGAGCRASGIHSHPQRGTSATSARLRCPRVRSQANGQQ